MIVDFNSKVSIPIDTNTPNSSFIELYIIPSAITKELYRKEQDLKEDEDPYIY